MGAAGAAGLRAVLTTFHDQAGRPLAHRAGGLSVDLQTYLTMLVFIDGSRGAPCVTGTFAFTAPGSRVIRLCVEELKRTWLQDQEHTVANFIDEMLHTLGLGENPPSSAEITRRVHVACRSRAYHEQRCWPTPGRGCRRHTAHDTILQRRAGRGERDRSSELAEDSHRRPVCTRRCPTDPRRGSDVARQSAMRERDLGPR
jgi:hypothetical protein